jgi:hypothetical protein
MHRKHPTPHSPTHQQIHPNHNIHRNSNPNPNNNNLRYLLLLLQKKEK